LAFWNQITIQYSINNIGTGDATNIYNKISAGTTDTDPAQIQAGPFSLSAGTSQSSLSLTWKYTAVGTYDSVINIDPEDSIIELENSNNQDTIGTIICSRSGSNIVCVKQ